MARATVETILKAAAALLLLAHEAAAHPPWGVVVDPQGQVYFSDLETVWKVDARGRLSVFRAGVSGRHTHELNGDADGNLYGEDLTYEPATGRYVAALWKMTPAGVFSYVLAPTDDAPKGVGVWRDRDGSTYSTLRRDETRGLLLLIKRSAGGVVTVLAGDKDAAARVRQVVPYGVGGMAFGADGTLYFADGASVLKLTPAGAVSPLARDIAVEAATTDNRAAAGRDDRAAAQRTNILGLAVNADGDVIAADLGGGRVLKVTQRGEVSTLARAERPWLPSGVATRGGDIFILESKGPPLAARVRKLSADGRLTLFATAGENVLVTAGENAPPAPEQSAAAARRPAADTDAAASKVEAANVEAADASARRAPYVVAALCAGAAALALFIWLASRARAAGRL